MLVRAETPTYFSIGRLCRSRLFRDRCDADGTAHCCTAGHGNADAHPDPNENAHTDAYPYTQAERDEHADADAHEHAPGHGRHDDGALRDPLLQRETTGV